MHKLFASSKRLMASFILLHIVIIAASNYFVQFPFTLFGFHNTWGALVFPLIYLASDLTVRLYGVKTARTVILMSMAPALIISYLITVLYDQGHLGEWSQLLEFNLFAFRIALASFMAYVLGQLFDILVFSKFRRTSKWWVAPFWSNNLGSLVDTFIFFSIAFYQSSDLFMAEHWVEIALGDYGFKCIMSTLLFLPAYGLFIQAITRMIQSKARQSLV